MPWFCIHVALVRMTITATVLTSTSDFEVQHPKNKRKPATELPEPPTLCSSDLPQARILQTQKRAIRSVVAFTADSIRAM